jgi:hypothetical protein
MHRVCAGYCAGRSSLFMAWPQRPGRDGGGHRALERAVEINKVARD